MSGCVKFILMQIAVCGGNAFVFDSDPQSEFDETVSKSQAIRKAAEEAGRFM